MGGDGRPGSELCGVAVQIPAFPGVISELPASELMVSGIAPRGSLLIRGRLTCVAKITRATVHQMQQLRRMAEKELVALVPLQVGAPLQS